MNQSDIETLFDPAQFASLGRSLVDLLSTYLQESLEAQSPVLRWDAPDIAMSGWRDSMPHKGVMDLDGFLQRLKTDVLDPSLRVHHPRNLGHQVAPPLPVAALADLVSALTNQAMAVYETGPSATLVERQVIQWLASSIGWQGAAGVLTPGGAQANLTALLAARQTMAGWDVWKQGAGAGAKLRILASEHAHYSVSRAAGIMGLGTNAVLAVPADPFGCMSMPALCSAWESSVARHEQPFVVVATAGSTPTGSIDPLAEIGAFCREKRLWLHVDGAHGASMLLSEQLGPSLKGIEQADSVVWDGHKLLYMPATVSALIYRDPKNSFAAFSQEASYLFQGGSDAAEDFNTSYRTLECTKRMMGLKLWTALTLYGTERLGELVKHVFATARQFSEMLGRAEDFELLMQPQTNIVCFRHLPHPALSHAEMNAYQTRLRTGLVRSGAFHLTQTSLDGEVWLRATVMNPMTMPNDLAQLLNKIREIAMLSDVN